MLQDLTCESFTPHLNQAFRLEVESQAVELELVEAAPVGREPGPGARSGFSLVFRGPAEPFLEQRTYPLEHARLGRLELFLVPIAKAEAGGFLYEAVFT